MEAPRGPVKKWVGVNGHRRGVEVGFGSQTIDVGAKIVAVRPPRWFLSCRRGMMVWFYLVCVIVCLSRLPYACI